MKFACASEITLWVMKSHFVSWYLALRDYDTLKSEFPFIVNNANDFIVSETRDFICTSSFSSYILTLSLTRGKIWYSKIRGIIMIQNKLVDLSTEFAVKILNFTSTINGHSSLSNQLERSGTSIGANIREANYAHGKSEKEATSLLHDCGVIWKLLITSPSFSLQWQYLYCNLLHLNEKVINNNDTPFCFHCIFLTE